MPTVAETLAGYEVGSWNGVAAPLGTPRPILDRMNAEVNRVLRDPAFVDEHRRIGSLTLPMAPGEVGEFLRADIARQAEAIRFANVQPE